MMPTKSEAQERLMQGVAHNPAFAKKVGIPQSVGREFTRPKQQVLNKRKTDQGSSELFKDGGVMKESKAMMGKEIAFMKKKGAPKSMIKHEMAEAKGMKKMASGGYTRAADGVASKGKTKAKQITMRMGGKC
jgi:hypothetical protein